MNIYITGKPNIGEVGGGTPCTEEEGTLHRNVLKAGCLSKVGAFKLRTFSVLPSTLSLFLSLPCPYLRLRIRLSTLRNLLILCRYLLGRKTLVNLITHVFVEAHPSPFVMSSRNTCVAAGRSGILRMTNFQIYVYSTNLW